jgi:hypothetical protein
MNGLCRRIHLAQVAAVGGCDGLVSALGLLILLLGVLSRGRALVVLTIAHDRPPASPSA